MIMRNLGSDLSRALRGLLPLAVALFALLALLAVAGCSSAATSGGPSIGTQPAAISVPDGAVASFTVAAAGDPTLAYQWRRDGVDLADGAGITGATTAALALTAQLAWTGSQISVRVSNGGGDVVSNDALLTVTPAAPGTPGGPPGTVDGTGKAWLPPALISTGALEGAAAHGEVVIDAAGNAAAVWIEVKGNRNALYSNVCVAGGKWEVPATIDASGEGNSQDPQLTISPSGVGAAVFTQTAAPNGGLSRLRSRRFDHGWTTSETIDAETGSPSEEQRVSVGTDGAAVVAFLQADATIPRVRVSAAAPGTPWDPVGTVVDNSGGTYPEVVRAANRHGVVSWVKAQGPASSTLWASRNVGASWSAPAQITPDAGKVARSIRLVADADGNTLAVWSQVIGTHYTVRSSRLDDATNVWSAPVSVSSGEHDASAEDLAADANGNAVVVWHEDAEGVFANRFTAATSAWSGPVKIATKPTPPSVSSQPRVGIDSKGNAVAVWLQVPSGQPGKRIYAAHLASGATSWGTPFDLMVEPTAYTTQAPRIAMNAEGQATVVWHQLTDSPPAAGIWARGYR